MSIQIQLGTSKLRYRLITHRESTAWRHTWKPIITSKSATPLVDATLNHPTPNGTFKSLVFIDIDSHQLDADHLKSVLPDAVVFLSPSGNAKAAYVFESDSPLTETDIEAKLKFLLPDYIQYDRAGLTRCFVNYAAASALASGIESAKVIWCDSCVPLRPNDIIEQSKPYKYTSSDPIPQALRFWATTAPKIKMIQLLVATWSLNKETGFNLPVHKLAEHCGIAPNTMSRWLHELQRLSILKCIDKSFQKGVKARTYIALNALRSAILQHRLSITQANKVENIHNIPKGAFYKTCLRLLPRFKNIDDFLRFVAPHCHGNRGKEAARYARWHFRRAVA